MTGQGHVLQNSQRSYCVAKSALNDLAEAATCWSGCRRGKRKHPKGCFVQLTLGRFVIPRVPTERSGRPFDQFSLTRKSQVRHWRRHFLRASESSLRLGCRIYGHGQCVHTLFVVTDDLSFLSLGFIASSSENPQAVHRPSDWQILYTAQAKETLGSFGGLCVHSLCVVVVLKLIIAAYTQHRRVRSHSFCNHTLFSLWRTYTTLDMSLSPDALTLPPPRRNLYPNVPAFMGEQPDPNGSIVPRQRSPSGFHPMVVKVDYALLHVPFVLKRVVVADQGAAHHARADLPSSAVPLTELRVVGADSEERRKVFGCARAGAQKVRVGHGQDGRDVPVSPGRGARTPK
ncbi:hypothetical protein JVT61DRAFT_5248 [Boletus reticuloceps]|uniref:Uncharacterized protein n=1 Tax=Boletus reticuloceps TaxID=495285 RepID=A0A8I2YWS0_9AGAM|nr:hypothetical protein JVT61DRAFT_5248 [Boletus reticuloceps]